MAFATLKKKIAISNQALSERFHKSKKTPVNEDYKQLSSLIDSYKHYFEEVRKRSTECLEPGTNFRIRPTNNSHGSHNNPAKEMYPHAELLLAQCFAKYAKEFDLESPLGSTLMYASEGYGQLTEAKNRAAEETQTRFVLPITETLGQEIKEIMHLRKKAESRRLAYEVERTRVQKGKIAPSSPQYIEAEQKFHEAYEAARLAMSNFLESEAEHIEMISNFITAQLGYVQDAQRVLTDLQSRIQQNRAQPGTRIPKPGSKLTAPDDGISDDVSYQAVQIKPKYDNVSAQVPVCRALYTFEAENPFELSFHEGDIIRLIEQVDENWYLGELGGKEGHFPTTYVQVLVPLP
ncbi:hypothetical protein EG68_02478 [Paragonimus skrjabini miyazakii]|uniref:Uncharacterized protein n=1 Tax=Paragonimus skrjabini miyazakii TaxID=59628 RepID=A0A8S9Z509_9TREM|nr:hypothetical protein EG68_02478 [Paragonimus skrjabini miyazakii]